MGTYRLLVDNAIKQTLANVLCDSLSVIMVSEGYIKCILDALNENVDFSVGMNKL